jgi:nitrite reductase/ring-hydroxylating ferredoxin subunit
MTTKFNVEFASCVISRRKLLKGALTLVPVMLTFSACERHRYIRPAAELDLGAVKELLYSTVHVRSKAVLLYRDVDGWSALSTRCTYRGCDLTHQEPVLLCPCCRTRYDLSGKPHQGWPATHPLPWIDVYYKDGHLYANPGKVRSPSWRFTTPEIEEAIRKLKKRVKLEGLKDEVVIPEVLKGKGDGTFGTQFLEDDPNLIDELRMIQ